MVGKKIGVVNSIGDTDSPRGYHFLDTSRKRFTDYFYKILQVDFTGRSTWSGVTKVVFPSENPGKEQLILFPNPYHSGDLDLILPKSMDAAKGNLMILDAQGKVIVGPSPLDQNIARHLLNLPPGIYLIRISSDQQVYTERLIRN